MRGSKHASIAIAALLQLVLGGAALGQKPGGTLRVYHIDSPASMSIHEEATILSVIPAMGVFNNLALYDQHVAQSSLGSIVPELATDWSWNVEKTALTFSCAMASNGTTASRSRPRTSNAPGTC